MKEITVSRAGTRSRVNAKSVTVAHGSIPGRTYRVPFHEIRGHKAG